MATYESHDAYFLVFRIRDFLDCKMNEDLDVLCAIPHACYL